MTALWTEKENRSRGLWATLILVTSLEYWFLSRLVLTDMFLALTVGSALFGFWTLRRSNSRLWSSLFWLSLGLSFLTKGPVGLAIVALTLAFYKAFGGQAPWKLLLRPEGPILGALVACPWYFVEISRFDGLFSYLVHFQTIERVATEVHGRGGPLWFYIPVILAGFFPWSPALWVAFRDAFRKREDKDLFLLAWILGPLLLFSISGSKLPTYLLPLYPAFAMLLARSLDDSRSARAVAISCSAGLTGFSLALIVFLKIGLPPEIAPNLTTLLWVTAVAGCGSVLSIFLCLSQRAEQAVTVVGGCFALVLLLLSSGIGKSDAAYSARKIAEAIESQGPNTIVAEYRDHLHGLPYYLHHRIVQVSFPRETQFEQNSDYKKFLFTTAEDFFTSLEPSQKALLIIRDSDYEQAELFHGYPHTKFGRWNLVELEGMSRHD